MHGEKVKVGHRRHLNKQLHDDLLMFDSFLQELSPEFNRTIPFMIQHNIEAHKIELWADAVGTHCLGMGCICQTHWAQGLWCDTNIFQVMPRPNIALLELFAIVTAFDLWAPQLARSTITLRSDSEATRGWVNSQKSDIPVTMSLLHHLTKTCLLFQIHVRIQHVKSKDNEMADKISRNQLALFHPQMDRDPTPLPDTVWPPVWWAEDMVPRKRLDPIKHSTPEGAPPSKRGKSVS